MRIYLSFMCLHTGLAVGEAESRHRARQASGWPPSIGGFSVETASQLVSFGCSLT
jgi:hypothetical protein